MLNNRQKQLWDNLNALAIQEAFFFVDQQKDDTWYRIFNYRLVNYTAFMQDDATECRGHMFEITQEGSTAVPIRLAAWPLHKFFNMNENPKTMDLDLSSISRITEKHDGSIITTYMHQGSLHLKSKGSLSSTQAIDSMRWLDLPENEQFKSILMKYTIGGFSVCLEWTSPFNRIVLSYIEPKLIILHIRNCATGRYLDPPPLISKFMSDDVIVRDPVAFVSSVPDMKDDIEGFVCILDSGLWFKLKTLKYLTLHHTKDSINSPRRLFEAVLEEATDDMRSLFVTDIQAIALIDDMEQFVDKTYNHLVDTVEKFYKANVSLDRKSFAIAGQRQLDKKCFGLAMTKYLNKPVNYKAFMKKNWKHYGLLDAITEEQQ